MRFLGADVAPTHSGFVVIDDDGAVVDLRYITTKKAAYDAAKGKTYLWKDPPDKDNLRKAVVRLQFMRSAFYEILEQLAPDFLAVEGYAWDTQGGHQMGEIGGAFRMAAVDGNIPFRIHDPLSLKMFAAWHGLAKKPQIIAAVKTRWGQDFKRYDGEGIKNVTTCEDLSDAYVLARLALTEHRLRMGVISLADLEHDKERHVFLRATKTQPVNILGTEWIQV